MNQKLKFFGGLFALAIVIGVSFFAYEALKKGRTPDLIPVQTTEAGDVSAATNAPGETEPEAIMAPDITIENADGEEVKFNDLLDGRPIVLNFWATWCTYCKQEMLDFEEVYKEMGDNIQFIMLDIVDGGRETVDTGRDYIEECGYTFPVYYDTLQEAAYTYGINSLPITLFISGDGELITISRGMTSKETLLKGIEILQGEDGSF